METVFELAEGLSRGGRRTGSQVWRNSHLRGREGRFWQPFSRRNASRYMLAAERFDQAGRLAARRARNGRKIGPLGPVALDVLRYMLRIIDWRSGRLEPALATIAASTGHSVAGVAAALKRLKRHGFTDWLRRVEPTGNQGLRGPQVQQVSNAYALQLPAQAVALLPKEPPPPEDWQAARAAKAAEFREMIDSLPVGERVRAEHGDDPINATLDRIAAGIAARDRLAEARQRIELNAIHTSGKNPPHS